MYLTTAEIISRISITAGQFGVQKRVLRIRELFKSANNDSKIFASFNALELFCISINKRINLAKRSI